MIFERKTIGKLCQRLYGKDIIGGILYCGKQTERTANKMMELYHGKEQINSADGDLRMANSKMSAEVRNFKKIKDFLELLRGRNCLK